MIQNLCPPSFKPNGISCLTHPFPCTLKVWPLPRGDKDTEPFSLTSGRKRWAELHVLAGCRKAWMGLVQHFASCLPCPRDSLGFRPPLSSPSCQAPVLTPPLLTWASHLSSCLDLSEPLWLRSPVGIRSLYLPPACLTLSPVSLSQTSREP